MIRAEEEIWRCALSLCLRHEGGLARRLYDHYGSAAAVFQEPVTELVRHRGVRRTLLEKMTDLGIRELAVRETEWLRKYHIRTLFLYDEEYPCRLRECADAPLLLYAAGPLDMNTGPVLAVVGTRSATPYGKSLCSQIINGFSPLGIRPVVVSGLAFGIDITAHKAALENNFPTIAVLPTGIDTIYPATHRDTAAEITRQGAVVSEFPSSTQGTRHNFLQRNRIIAGLADATLVVESKADGGALITAHLACDYARDVLAVPGRPADTCSAGCNELIKMNKAALVTCAEDVADILGWEKPRKNKNTLQKELFDSLDQKERLVLNGIRETGGDINAMAESLGLPFPELSALITTLQVKGLVECMENKEYRSLL